MSGYPWRARSVVLTPAPWLSAAYDLAMSRALKDAAARVLVLLMVMVGAVLGIVLPALLTAGAGAPSTAVTVVSLAVAALLALGIVFRVPLAGGCRASSLLGREGPPPVLSGRVTDRVHHPLRPRAPGLG
jgi:hypothetical protein